VIVRLVRLKVDPKKVEEFKALFESLYDGIRAHRGCISLRLITDLEGLGEFFTLSEWESPEALEAYRQSFFFRETWPRVKAFLKEKAWAQSFHILLGGKAEI
jgi:quinol monooxygenase YgiN